MELAGMSQTKAYLHGNGDMKKSLVVVFCAAVQTGWRWFRLLAMMDTIGFARELRSVKKRQSNSTTDSASTR